MKKELKWIIAVLVFALFIGGAYFLYDKLGEDFAPDRLAESTPSEDAPSKEDVPSNEDEKAPDFTVYDREGNMITYAMGMIDYETLLKGIDMITE